MGAGKKQEESVVVEQKIGESTSEDSKAENGDDKKVFFFCRFVASYPVGSFLATLGGHILIIVVTAALVVGGYDLFPTNFETLPLQLRDEPWLKRDYAWRYKNNFTPRVTRTLSSGTTTWTRSLTTEGVELLYDAGGGNIFTQENLLKMQEIENALTSVTQYTDYCQLESTMVCKKPISVLRYFDGTYAAYNSTMNDTSFSNIAGVLYSASVTLETKGDFLYHQAQDMTLTPTQVAAGITRTLITMGTPLAGVSGAADTADAIQTFELTYMKPVLESFLSTSQFDFMYYSPLLMFGEVQKQAITDMMLAVGSMFFIFGFMCFHTRSLWITAWAVFSILSSFAATNLIYRIVFDYKYFGYFHILAIFIVLGIGADDLFVFYDAWRASGTKVFPSLSHRLWEAFKKSAISMLITSLTTMVAFLSSALSPLLATKTFGIFTAILVVINYLSVIIFFPTVVILYHVKFENWTWPCCRCCIKKKTDNDQTPPPATRATTKLDFRSDPESGNAAPVFVKTKSTFSSSAPGDPVIFGDLDDFPNSKHASKESDDKEGNSSSEEGKTEKPSIVVVFFKTHYFDFINHKIWRWVLLAFFVAVIVFFAYYSSKLEPDNEQIQLYKSTHNYAKAINRRLYSFVSNELEAFVQLYLVWGLELQDLSGCHHSAVQCYGTNSYDSNFDISEVSAQTAFKALCDELLSFTEQQVQDYKIRRDAVTNNLEISCFTNNLLTFLQNDSVSSSMDVSLPWNWTTTETFINHKSAYFPSGHFNSSFTRYLNIPVSYWLTNGFTRTYSDDWQIYNKLISEQEDTFTTYADNATSVKIGNRIKYVAIEVNTTLNGQSLGYSEGIPIVEKWEAFMTEKLASMPASLQSGFQVVKTFWHWLYVQKALADNAVMGIAVGICLGFVVLVAATQNIILGFLATLSIGCTTVCVIGVVPLGGWKLGVLVSLNMCLVVGLSVDYVVHLAEGYHMSPHKDRKSRTRDTLDSMGISVFSGACTTLGAAMFMLFAEIQFFFQFGIFMFCTIGFSLLFSLGMFITLTALLGPENDTGDLKVFFTKYLCRCRKKPSTQAAVAPTDHTRAFE